MSRSFRHTPKIGVCGNTEKQFKRMSNRILRATQKRLLGTVDPDALVLPLKSREVVETWSGPKDGKRLLDLSNPPARASLRK